MATAQVLPDDWSPLESEVVIIPANSVVASTRGATSYAVASAPIEQQGTSRGTPMAKARIVSEPMKSSSHSSGDGMSAVAPTASAPIAPSAPPEEHSVASLSGPPLTLSSLQDTLSASKRPFDAIEQEIRNNGHNATALLASLSPHDFVETLKCCHTQQPDVARVLAMTMAPNFYSRHVLACLWGLSPQIRFPVVQQVAPLASDLETQRSTVERELTPTELEFFRAAIQ